MGQWIFVRTRSDSEYTSDAASGIRGWGCVFVDSNMKRVREDEGRVIVPRNPLSLLFYSSVSSVARLQAGLIPSSELENTITRR